MSRGHVGARETVADEQERKAVPLGVCGLILNIGSSDNFMA
jgi:hypothetical protein